MIFPTSYVIGVDEVGRGCLYGSVIAAAVVLPLELKEQEWDEIKDSKKISEKKRNRLAEFIKSKALYYGIGESTQEEIDKTNILKASIKAMHRAIDKCYNVVKEHNKEMFESILVDGNYFIPYTNANNEDTIIPYECIIQGDNKHLTIAAASILAKTYRDNMIIEECNANETLKLYDIHKNKGYGTKKHIETVHKLGPIDGHRLSFKPFV